MHPRRLFALVPVFLLVLAGCGGGGGTVPAPRSTPGGAAPAATVERFLRLVNAKDYMEMGYVFGTRDGPLIRRDPARQVERRMYAMATLLTHESFAIRAEENVPGRSGEAVQLNVQLTQRGQNRLVPFTVVRSGDRWYVEAVDLERITRGT